MMGPTIFGDPIDPNEPISEPPPFYPPWTGGHPAYLAYPTYLAPPDGPYQPRDGSPRTDPRPGEVVTATVLSLVTAGLLLITGFVVIFAASSLETADTSVEDSQRTSLFVGAGLVNVITAALLIIGGVALLSRSRAGRSAVVVGALLCLALGAFWLTEDNNDGGIIVWLFIFCGPALVAGLLACTARVTSWLGPAPVR